MTIKLIALQLLHKQYNSRNTFDMSSGVFRISVRRGRSAVSVEGGWVWCRGWDPPQKKIIFCLQNDKFGCILMQFLTGRKHGQSRITQYKRKTKLTQTVQKLSKKFTIRPSGGRSHHCPRQIHPLYVRILKANINNFNRSNTATSNKEHPQLIKYN